MHRSDSHTAVDFLAFMNKVERAYPSQELHVILDNSSSHCTPQVKAWLDAHPRVQFHFTPTSACWLNQVEGFFGILGNQSLSETDFPSKKALREHLAAYMRSWNKDPTPFAWTGQSPMRRAKHRTSQLRASHSALLLLAADDPKAARRQMREARARWPQTPILAQDCRAKY